MVQLEPASSGIGLDASSSEGRAVLLALGAAAALSCGSGVPTRPPSAPLLPALRLNTLASSCGRRSLFRCVGCKMNAIVDTGMGRMYASVSRLYRVIQRIHSPLLLGAHVIQSKGHAPMSSSNAIEASPRGRQVRLVIGRVGVLGIVLPRGQRRGLTHWHPS